MNDDYLWDRSGTAEPDIAQLEHSLAAYSLPDVELGRQVVLTLPARREWLSLFAVAMATVAVVAFVWWLRREPDWRLIRTEGVVEHDHLATGGYLRTMALSRAVMQVADIGEITVEGESSVHMVESRPGRRRLVLDYGTLRADITADPGVFVVDTPCVRATDLGCAYTLRIGRQGGGFLRVESGWVALDYGGVQSLVPQGAMAVIGRKGQFTPPFFRDATRLFQSALTSWSLGATGERTALFGAILHEARPRDALTLLNLFRDASPRERYKLYDRLNELVPNLPEIGRDQVFEWTPPVTEPWWPVVIKSLGLDSIKKTKRLDLPAFPH